ncbi:flagellar basal body L-ring protein FlgH [Escherichia coli]|nr:flagellar basal body L-ring protein FlgH [Escherichia coli]EGZ9232185.1 flagellar basal body L-ring protein FlgH [Escherichia coli]
MNAALWISKTGLSAQDAEMSAIANNIANVNTTGFKRDRVMFQDLFYQTLEAPGAMLDQNNIMPTGLQFGSGVRIVGTQKTFTEGNVETTDNAMNVAIMGQGFLQVQKANGDIAYTRDGNLQVNADGVLTNSQGLPLQPEIDVPAGATNVAFGEDGTVTAILPGDSDVTELGQLTLVNFANPAGLSAEGDNLYLETAASGQPTEGVPGEDGLGTLQDNALEGSNVDIVNEMVALLPLLSGCESQAILVKKDDAYFAPPKTEAPPPADGRAGGVFETGYNWSLTADRRAYRVGDILTVILEESTQSSKQAKTNFGKSNTVDIGAPTIFSHTKDKLSGSIDANRDFDGSATSQQQNSLRGEITVSVHAVQPNGILEIRGEKWLTLNQGDEYIRLSGLVRADDIQNDNSVSSQRIADARISYAGRGALSDANAAGWLTRLFNHPLFPI